MPTPRFRSVCFSGLALFWAVPAIGCDNPAVHPEMAEYDALLAALPANPPSPLQLKFKIDGDHRPDRPIRLRIAFWQKENCESGQYVITPSVGVDLEGGDRNGAIPCRGAIDFVVRASRPGYHYFKVETRVDDDGVSIQRTDLIGLPIDLNDSPVAKIAGGGTGRFDFAGSRLRDVLTAKQGDAMQSRQNP